MRMWQSDSGRDTMSPWGDAQPSEAPAYAVGDTVYSGNSGSGTVVSVEGGYISVVWDDTDLRTNSLPCECNVPKKGLAMGVRQTHAYAELELSSATYTEIAQKLRAAGYCHAFMDDGTIDMHGIGIFATCTIAVPDLVKIA